MSWSSLRSELHAAASELSSISDAARALPRGLGPTCQPFSRLFPKPQSFLDQLTGRRPSKIAADELDAVALDLLAVHAPTAIEPLARRIFGAEAPRPVRRSAAIALARSGSDAALEVIFDALANADPVAHIALAYCTHPSLGARVAAVLERALGSPERGSLPDLLGVVGRARLASTIPLVVQALARSDVWEPAAQALESIDTHEARLALATCLDRSDVLPLDLERRAIMAALSVDSLAAFDRFSARLDATRLREAHGIDAAAPLIHALVAEELLARRGNRSAALADPRWGEAFLAYLRAGVVLGCELDALRCHVRLRGRAFGSALRDAIAEGATKGGAERFRALADALAPVTSKRS